MGLFRQATEHFEKAAQDPAYALKGFAHMGLSLKQSGKLQEAAVAFRRALQVPSTSSKEQVQILYLLGRTLESLGRSPEALRPIDGSAVKHHNIEMSPCESSR